MDKIQGTITKKVFMNKNFYICKFLTIKKDKISILGYFDEEPSKDFLYTFNGIYKNNNKYGMTFEIKQLIKREINININNSVNFLSSNLFKGIGKKTANHIVNYLGENSVHLLIKKPNKINKLGFLSEKQRNTILNALNKHKNVNEIYKFLFDHNIDIKIFNKIKEKFNDLNEKEILEIIKKDIFIFLDENYLNFKEIDSIYLKLNENKELNEKRLAHISYYLINNYCFQNNHTKITIDKLYELIINYLKKTHFHFSEFKDLKDKIKRSWLYSKNKQMLIFIKPYVSIYNIYLKEKIISEHLFFNNKKNNNKYEAIYESYDENIYYDNSQKKALHYALENKMSIISGGPGTGKTSIIQLIIDNFKFNYPEYKIKLLAPTGRAAKRISQKTTMNASTIHSYLKWNGNMKVLYDNNNPVEEEVIIVDEMSMVNNETFFFLMNACINVKHFIFIGDINQLSAIGPGNILEDIIKIKDIPTTFLEKVYRQEKGNDIIKLAKNVLNKNISINDFKESNEVNFIINEHVKLEAYDIVNNLIKKNVDLINDVQFISPLYKSLNGVNKINDWFQEKNNNNQTISFFNKTFFLHDKVMQIINRPEIDIYNGDIGFVSKIDKKEEILYVQFDNILIKYNFDNINEIILSYGSTVHKVQGSEYDNVIIILDNVNIDMINNQAIYTAITRAKNKLYIISQIDVFMNAINKNRSIVETNIIQFYKTLKNTQ